MRRIDEPAGPISTRDARAAGIPRGRDRAAGVAHPHHGVLVFGEAATDLRARCRELDPIWRDRWFFSHRTAAELWGAALPSPLPGALALPLDVAVRFPATPPRRPGIVGHRVDGVDLALVEALPVVSAVDAWCELGALLDLDDLVAAGDSLLPGVHREGATTRDELERAAERHRRDHGAAQVRRALPLLREQVDSRPETLLRLALMRAGLPEPRVAWPIATAGRVYHADLAYPERRLALEYEGDGHRTSRTTWRRDLGRREDIEDGGWRVVRVTAADLAEGFARVIERVRRLLGAG